ncbi:MAG: glycine cleavage system protein H [Ignavibacteriae bacterium]|nr:glycine cleavage system protein H [Ignavibacteriota bacterium]
MTVLLVLFTLIGFLVADYLLHQRSQKALALAALKSVEMLGPRPAFADGLALAPNHLWMRREKNNTITVGIDNFIAGLVGVVERIQVPEEGAIVGGKPSITIHDKKKTLRLTVPIEGQVLSVNHESLQLPALVKNDPYTTGWLFNVVPSGDARSLRSFMQGDAALNWLKEQNKLVKEFLAAGGSHLHFATMHDGGVPVDGVLKAFDQDVWTEFEKQFATLPAEFEPTEIGEYDNA